MRIIIIILAIFLVTILASSDRSAETAGDKDIQKYVLKVEGDTIYYKWGESEGAISVGNLSNYDTSRVGVEHDFILVSNLDTLTIKPDSLPVNLLFVLGKDTIVETVLFLDYESEEREELKAKEGRLKLLREYSKFGKTPGENIPQFYYADSKDTNLIKLKELYNLDSVAGHGDEIEKIINLMKWVHNIVRHDGNSPNPTPTPTPTNALDIISVCKKENRGANCRLMATILNEVYLAMGFPSRHITCLPFDKEDTDCHVINMVYSESLKKWLNMDPSFEAYFMDKDSNILGINEIRQKMIADEKLILNEEINWNGQPRSEDTHLSYMSKNLFRFSCPLGSGFGYESNDSQADWVYLNPTGYDSDKINTTDTLGTSDNKFFKHYTDNDELFWAKP